MPAAAKCLAPALLAALAFACGGDDDGDTPTATPTRRPPVSTPARTPTPSATIPPSVAAPTTEATASPPIPATAGPAVSGEPAVLVGAGDIASCTSDGDEAVADLLDTIPGTIVTFGDNAYPDGTAGDFASCYQPGWGRHKARTRPSPGNHDYVTSGALPYFEYFGDAAGRPGEGYYSYQAGPWHVIALNSNCWAIGGCGEGSAQAEWLRNDLASHPAACTVAYWHHPVVTIGPHEHDEAGMLPIWQILYDTGVDVVLNGHEHSYQRYAPLNRNADGVDQAAGIRLFVVGTGGSNLTNAEADFADSIPGLELWADTPGDADERDTSFGVIRLALTERAYEWEFVPIFGGSFADGGTGTCH